MCQHPWPTVPVARTPSRVSRHGFTLIEILLVLVASALLFASVLALTGGTSRAVTGEKTRAALAAQRALLDERVGAELGRIAPTLGDISYAGASQLSFRKRQLPGAVVCDVDVQGGLPGAYVAVTASDDAALVAGDSGAVRDAMATSNLADDQWRFGVMQRYTGGTPAGCTGAAGGTLYRIPLNAAVGIARGASVRIWTTRSYTVTALPLDSGFALVETINGGAPARIYGPFATNTPFTYYAGGSYASSIQTITRVMAVFSPLGTRDGQRSMFRPETFHWPTAADVRGGAGDVMQSIGYITPINPTTPPPPKPTCQTPGALNYGAEGACVFPNACPSNPAIYENDPSCVSDPGYCSGSETRQVACPSGETGAIQQQRDATGQQPSCGWGAWFETSRSCQGGGGGCTESPVTYQCPAGYSGTYGGTINSCTGAFTQTASNCSRTEVTCNDVWYCQQNGPVRPDYTGYQCNNQKTFADATPLRCTLTRQCSDGSSQVTETRTCTGWSYAGAEACYGPENDCGIN